MSRYAWHGEPVKVKFGFCHVSENKEKPMWWYNYECHTDEFDPMYKTAIINAIMVTPKSGSSFVIANHSGIGVHKLLRGGWPDHVHFSLDIKDFQEDKLFMQTHFNEIEYSMHEAGREKWQKENYPEEYAKMDELRRMASKRRLGF